MTSGPVIARRAVLGDYEAVLDINRNIYAGFDYVPALYFTYFHDNQHVIYVLEQDGQLISLVNYELNRDGTHVTTMSSRVRPSHQGRGMSVEKSAELKTMLFKEFPRVTHELYAMRVHDKTNKKMSKSKILFRWERMVYHIVISDILPKLQVAKSKSSPALMELSYSTAIDWLSNTDVIEDFFKQYTTEYIPVGPTNRLARINQEELKSVFAGSRVFASLKVNKDISGRPTAGGSAKIDALSFCNIVPAAIGLRSDLHFYGEVTDLCDHVAAQLLHVGTVCDKNVGIVLHFMHQIGLDKVVSCLSDMGLTRDKIELVFGRAELILGVKEFKF